MEARRRPSGTGRFLVARRAGASRPSPAVLGRRRSSVFPKILGMRAGPRPCRPAPARAAAAVSGRRGHPCARRRALGRRRTSLCNTRRGRPFVIGPPPPRRRGLLGDASTASCCAAARCVRHAADCQHLAAQELLKLVQSWHRNAAVQPPEAKISLKPKSAMPDGALARQRGPF